jgi:multiple sugar transport system ATP-binding protein
VTLSHVELKGVSKSFGAVEAIRRLSLSVEKGSFVALLGPSGCGKSTLLRMIAGLEDATEGAISIAGRDVTDLEPADRRIAMVFQSYALYPHMTVRQNISFSLSIAGRPRTEIAAKSLAVAQMLQLEDLLDRRPSQLSGGQRQRVAIGRALVREPEVFLFDEPLSNLDAMLRVQMRIELAKLHRKLGITMIYVTHDQIEAMTLADRIVVLNKGEISQIGTPLELYHRPANKFVATFIGTPAMNFIPASLETNATLRLPNGATLTLRRGIDSNSAFPQEVEAAIRPEHVNFGIPNSASSSFTGIVQMVERLGNATVAYVDTEAGPLVVQDGGDASIKPGEKIGLSLDAAHLHVFDGNGKALVTDAS